ncbi:neuroglian isoform X3 [Daphnia magna]|uniref:Neuronal cell adhesion molecule n=1 Tax=Daphnia magna TaxID=35525 RepID=A0ABQ9ZT30_9CRUS|nr:neuroglian isoform X3 [Daphnia magna]KAK4016086.1 hypothetical protein OUZ56_031047 [Daphnia magna]
MAGPRLGTSGLLMVLFCMASTSAMVQSPPQIVKQPPSDELLFQVAQRIDENDKPFIIECEAEGEPGPKYRWVKNGFDFLWQSYDDRISQQPGRGTLVITTPRDEDIGQYQCFASNEWGTATSNSVFVRKSDLNSFKDEPPMTVSAQEGSPFSLRCQPPDGWPKPSVYWMMQNSNGALRSINSSRMTVDPEGTLWFSNVTREDTSDDFVYACSATSLFRNEYKLGNKVYLDVIATGSAAAQNRHEPVSQYVSRKNAVAHRGKSIELWCVFGGTPLPQIRWTKEGAALPAGRTTYSSYGKTLIIKSVDSEDAGNYECEASNGVGLAKSYSISLQVLAAPYFTVEPEVYVGAEDEVAEFRCEANGSPSPEIKWIHNGKPLEEAAVNPRRKVFPNRIVIERLQKSDTGNYGCNATNSIGYVYKDVYLNVLALAPDIEDAPDDTATVDGLAVNLTCKVFGSPKPLVKWIRDGLELTGGRYRVMDSGDLEIRDVTFTDAGVYSCHATNKFGSANANGTLIVKERTVIRDGPEDYEVAAGQTATFRCNAVADSSLNMTIEWLHADQLIDFEQEPRFVQSQDSSLTITKTTELDTGDYTCRAKTILDMAEDKATLIVQDVPNRPRMVGIQCNNRDAAIEWTPSGDNRAPILTYTIQFNTSFTPDSWEVSFENVPATETRFKVEMSPWSNYTFRVIARNKIGPSLPSDHSSMCTTPPDVPNKNPDNVEGRGTSPTNLVVTWNPMPEIEHNGRNFHYRVYWRRDIPGEDWNIEMISDWRQSSILIPNQPTFKRYRIKVVAFNQVGEANVAAQEVTGYSGEDVPLEAPSNFTLNQIIDERSAILSWNPVNTDSVQGHFKGYKIETWTEKEGEIRAREMISNASKAFVNKFVPHTVNLVRVRVINSAYRGPASDILSFKTPEGRPGPVDYFEAAPLGSSAFYLIWKQPEEPNGNLRGYKIFYEKVEGTKIGPQIEREPPIRDPTQTRAKLAGLEPNTKYRLHIKAMTIAGEGDDYYIERSTRNGNAYPPDKPQFTWNQVTLDNGMPAIKVVWHPNVDGQPGSHFFVQFRRKGETIYIKSEDEFDENFIILRGLEPNQLYEICAVVVDGDYFTESDPEEVEMYADGPYIQGSSAVASTGWFIGMMLALALLLLVLVLVCIIKRNRGGKYAVHEREATHGRKDFNEDAGFHEYSQPVGSSRAPSKASLSSGAKMPPESEDNDSMAEYGEGEAGEFAESGSFIGQYGQNKLPTPLTTASVATIV